MPARRPAAPAYDEPLALDDAYDEPPVEAWEAGERTPEGPLRVCLACGESPPFGPGCEHPAVATLEHAPDDLVAAARRLAIAARAYRECERALKRLVTREQEAGRAELSSPPPRIARPAAPEANAPPCPRCGFPDTPPTTGRPARRPSSKHVSQTLFSFAAASAPNAPPEAPPDEPPLVVASDAMPIDASVAAPPSAGEARQKRPKKPR